jgi:hypothetical protein
VQQVAECAESVGPHGSVYSAEAGRRQPQYVGRVRWALQLTQLPIRSDTWKETIDVGEPAREVKPRAARPSKQGPRKAKGKPIRQQAVEGAEMSVNRVLGTLRSGRLP